jgi:hypothetical protein
MRYKPAHRVVTPIRSHRTATIHASAATGGFFATSLCLSAFSDFLGACVHGTNAQHDTNPDPCARSDCRWLIRVFLASPHQNKKDSTQAIGRITTEAISHSEIRASVSPSSPNVAVAQPEEGSKSLRSEYVMNSSLPVYKISKLPPESSSSSKASRKSRLFVLQQQDSGTRGWQPDMVGRRMVVEECAEEKAASHIILSSWPILTPDAAAKNQLWHMYISKPLLPWPNISSIPKHHGVLLPQGRPSSQKPL